ncbi:MAG: ATP-binding cassette domain-containing protein [bacterium]
MIKLAGISKRLNGRQVLDGVDLVVSDGETLVILGPSGIGKTVLLRIMAGLLPSDAGSVTYDGVLIRYGAFSRNAPVLAQLGYVFQNGALFDSLSVFDNVALPLRETRSGGERQVQQRVRQVLARVGMAEHERLMPSELSGGMARLVALARALAVDPRWIFYDEPTNGLDPLMRARILELIAGLRETEGRTNVIVTHDLDAARQVAGRCLMLRDGRLARLDDVRKEQYEPECA